MNAHRIRLVRTNEAIGWHAALAANAGRRRSAAGASVGQLQSQGSLERSQGRARARRSSGRRRETLEETGITPPEKLISLGEITYTKSRKRIFCYAGEVSLTATAAPASWEVDQAEFLPIDEARRRIHPDQAVFLDRLMETCG